MFGGNDQTVLRWINSAIFWCCPVYGTGRNNSRIGNLHSRTRVQEPRLADLSRVPPAGSADASDLGAPSVLGPFLCAISAEAKTTLLTQPGLSLGAFRNSEFD